MVNVIVSLFSLNARGQATIFLSLKKSVTLVTDTPLSETGFMEWEPGQPVNTTNEDCGCIYAKTGNLHDCICSDVLPFFCEKELK